MLSLLEVRIRPVDFSSFVSEVGCETTSHPHSRF